MRIDGSQSREVLGDDFDFEALEADLMSRRTNDLPFVDSRAALSKRLRRYAHASRPPRDPSADAISITTPKELDHSHTEPPQSSLGRFASSRFVDQIHSAALASPETA